MNLGVNFEFDNIQEVIKTKEGFTLVGENGQYNGLAVIIATGSKHRHLGLPKEEELTGHGISYCAVCDGPFYTGKDIIVVGGGNSAMQEAILLSGYCKSVLMVQNLDKLTGEASSAEFIEKTDNINVIYNKVVVELCGTDTLDAIIVEDVNTKEREKITTDGIFVAIGQVADNEPFKNVCNLDNAGFIISNDSCTSEVEGIFVAGDCRQKRIRQISTAISDGTIAAVEAIKYLDR
jgi:thioredoxin reductase (NADPH)